MIISEKWLRDDWIDPDLDTAALAHQLTMAGLEVDAVTPVAEAFSGVVIAEITSAEQHPNADKLRLCQVDTGAETVQIVCGAPNARVGLKAPLARVGAVLPGDFRIKAAKLRGVESQGMLCAASELGINEDAEGLMELPVDAPVGADLRVYLGLDDHTIEIGLTPNRADCLGLAGIARDLAVITGARLGGPDCAPVPASSAATFPVVVDAPERCPRYLGRVIENVDLSATTPLWMTERLRRAGLRAIDPVVDVTNYVMLELGQPLHAFDRDQLAGGIVVRTAAEGERLTLLDGTDKALTEDTLVIADHHTPLAMAGIMGGEGSGVSATTRNLFLESAFFAPMPMAGRARAYGLHTDSSHRYERGVDPDLQRRAIERATRLILDCVGGTPGPVTEVESVPHLPERNPIALRRQRIARLLGFLPEDAEVERILTGLGFGLEHDADGWRCTPPSWRFDMAREADLIEEVARIHGYDALPVSTIRADLVMRPGTETRRSATRVKRQLAARGFAEAITYSFVAPEHQALFADGVAPVALRNPISRELGVMRTSLIPGLVNVLAHNSKRQADRVRVFETGLRFLPGATLAQVPTLALAIAGRRDRENWTASSAAADFFDLKGEVEMLFGHLDTGRLRFAATMRPGLHDGQTAVISIDDRVVGCIGALHPAVAGQFDLPAAVVAELDLDAVLEAPVPAYRDISRFPEMRRDIAVLVPREVSSAAVAAAVREAAGSYLRDLTVFDVYVGEHIDPERKSLALGLTFRDPERTLDDQEVAATVLQVVEKLKEKLGAELRG